MIFDGIQVWGDSVLRGVVYDPMRKRYAIIRENAVAMIASALGLPIRNMSRMGRTAPEGYDAIRAQGADALHNQLVVVEFGGNDCDFDWAKVAQAPDKAHAPKTTLEAFGNAMEGIVRFVRDAGGSPVLCTLPPLDADRYFAWITRDGLSKAGILSYLGEPERIYRWQELYSNVILRLSGRLRCACLPMREAFLENVRGEDVLCIDGIHPNVTGHALIARYATTYRETVLAGA